MPETNTPSRDPGAAATCEALDEDLDALVVGAGLGGMLSGAELHRAGIGSFRVVDIAAAQPLARHAGIRERALRPPRVVRLEWHQPSRCWHATTDRGDRLRARFVILSPGPHADVLAAAPQGSNHCRLVGRDGMTLGERWADGVRTVHGTQLAGFPNLHIVSDGLHCAAPFDLALLFEIQAGHAVEQIGRCRSEGVSVSEVTEAAEARWLQTLREFEASRSTQRTPLVGATFAGTPAEYQRHITQWRSFGYVLDTCREAGMPATAEA